MDDAELDTNAGNVFGRVMPEDMLKFGMIPEFIGRLPVFTSVIALDREALVKVLTEPRNALVRQYQRLFELDNVELEFTPDALEAVADQAILRGTGARGLRAIMEEVLLSVMYDVPSRDDVARVVVNREVVLDNVLPTLVPRDADPGTPRAPRQVRLSRATRSRPAGLARRRRPRRPARRRPAGPAEAASSATSHARTRASRAGGGELRPQPGRSPAQARPPVAHGCGLRLGSSCWVTGSASVTGASSVAAAGPTGTGGRAGSVGSSCAATAASMRCCSACRRAASARATASISVAGSTVDSGGGSMAGSAAGAAGASSWCRWNRPPAVLVDEVGLRRRPRHRWVGESDTGEHGRPGHAGAEGFGLGRLGHAAHLGSRQARSARPLTGPGGGR